MKIKHLAVFLLIIFLASPAYAANQIKYTTADGEILCMGAMPSLEAGAGEAVVTVDFEIPQNLSHYTFNGTSLVEKDAAVIARLEAEKNFDKKIFFGRLIQEFSAERWYALSKLGVGWTMDQLISYPNWPGLKAYATALIADETITEADALIINAVLLEQGINLENY
jgi:hypothetical protein